MSVKIPFQLFGCVISAPGICNPIHNRAFISHSSLPLASFANVLALEPRSMIAAAGHAPGSPHEGKDLRRQPLSKRRDVMEKSIGSSSKALLPSHRLATDGLEAFRTATRRGYEGLVAKDLSSPCVEARSTKWLKVKVHQEDEFVIGGFTRPAGSRQYFGALLLGAYDQQGLRYVGKVGTGFDQKTLAALYRKFRPFVRSRPALWDPPRQKGVVFLAPRLVSQISFQEWTADRKLRQPIFLGLRDDKPPQDVLLPAIPV